jgi:lysophospholipase L1-like esterase
MGAVIVLAGAVYVIRENRAPAASGHHTAKNHNAGRPSADPPTSQPTEQPKPPIVAFLGDDWTAGTGASTRKHRFTTLVSQELDVIERNFGADGTGYAKTTATDGDYAHRVDDVVATHPDVVVVSGGRNDAHNLLATVASRARTLFHLLHAALPHATLVAVAPMWGDSDKPAELRAIGQAVKQAVTAASGTYLDISDPIHDHPGFMANAADPDDDGYAAIATALKPELKPLTATPAR